MRAFACVVLMCCLLATWNTTRVGSQNLTQTAPNVVTDWALVAQNTIAPVFLGGQLAYGPWCRSRCATRRWRSLVAIAPTPRR